MNPEPKLRRIGKRALTQNAYAQFWSLFVIVLHGTNNEQGQPRPHDFFCAGPHNKARENSWRIACSAISAITRHTPPLRLSFFFSRVEKALKVERSPNCGGMYNALRRPFFSPSAGGICRTPSRYRTLAFFAGVSSRALAPWGQYPRLRCG